MPINDVYRNWITIYFDLHSTMCCLIFYHFLLPSICFSLFRFYCLSFSLHFTRLSFSHSFFASSLFLFRFFSPSLLLSLFSFSFSHFLHFLFESLSTFASSPHLCRSLSRSISFLCDCQKSTWTVRRFMTHDAMHLRTGILMSSQWNAKHHRTCHVI